MGKNLNLSNVTERAALRIFSTLLIVASMALAACGGAQGENSTQAATNGGLQSGPTSIARGTRKFTKDALVFNGSGAWAAEVPSIQSILSSNGATYDTVSSSQINSMSVDDLAQYGAIIWPGGEAGTQADSLTQNAKANLRAAVHERGVSWLGFCAGAFIAVESDATGNNAVYGLGIVRAPTLKYYYLEAQLSNSGQSDVAMTMYSLADGSKRDVVWYGGPVTLSGANTVVAKYPTGEPAISQIWSGNGLVILSGGHPTATQAVRDYFGLSDSDGTDFGLTWKLMNAAIKQQDLTTF